MILSELIQLYNQHAQRYYRKPSGRPTSEASSVEMALRPLLLTAGQLPADQVNAQTIAAARRWLLENTDNCRKTVNAKVGRMVRMFAWAADPEQSLIDPLVLARVRATRPLQYGRTPARETPGLDAVPRSAVTDLLAALFEPLSDGRMVSPAIARSRRRLATMVELQLETGMRSGELCSMSCETLSRRGSALLYQPTEHKTEHRGRRRLVLIVGAGERLLTRWLADQRISSGPVFALTPSAYRQSIQRQLKRAGLPRWTPHQLRHAMAVQTRSEHGLDVVQALLGHASPRTSEIYAPMEVNDALIRRLEQ